MRGIRLAASLGLALATAPTARAQEAPCAVSKAQYDILNRGMTYREAVKILGCYGEEISRTETRGGSTVVYAWGGKKIVAIDPTMNATFINDKLTGKSESGLR